MNEYKIMAIDDEQVILDSIKDYFDDFEINIYNDPLKAMNKLKTNFYDIIIADYKMPNLNGLELLLEAKRNKSYDYGILLTAYAEKDLLEQFINKNLIRNVIEKPLKLDLLKEVLDIALIECRIKAEQENEVDRLKSFYKYALEELNLDITSIIGFNSGLKDVYDKILKVSSSNESILITGETGTGKEVLAKTVHLLSKRKNFPFIKINCAAIPNDLLESELFGYVKGAFTGANNDKLGKIELSNKGTLFLDEIGELKPEMQTKLLHVLQEKKYQRVGSNDNIDIDFRLITATNQNLSLAISQKSFREDLYYRINTINLHVPPLRERTQDLDEMIDRIVENYCYEIGIKKITIDKDAKEMLKKYRWPGNIRELENVLKRTILLNQDKDSLSESVFKYLFLNEFKNNNKDEMINAIISKIVNEKKDINTIEKEVLNTLLNNYNGNVMEAVKATGIPKDRFYRIRKK